MTLNTSDYWSYLNDNAISVHGTRTCKFICVILFLAFIDPQNVLADNHRNVDRLQIQCHPSGAVINGGGGLWDTIFSAAKRNARIKWYRAVRRSATMGRDWDDWGIADRNVFYNDCNDGYCCRTKRVWGVKWHSCSAYAIPCRYVDVPREGEIEPTQEPLPQRTGAALIVEDISLEVERVSRANECPVVFTLRATVEATGQVGLIRLRIRSGDEPRRVNPTNEPQRVNPSNNPQRVNTTGDQDTIVLKGVDFETTRNGKKIAKHTFVRKFNGIVDNKYTLSVVEGPTRWGNETQRANPTRRVSAGCRTADLDGLTIERRLPTE